MTFLDRTTHAGYVVWDEKYHLAYRGRIYDSEMKAEEVRQGIAWHNRDRYKVRRIEIVGSRSLAQPGDEWGDEAAWLIEYAPDGGPTLYYWAIGRGWVAEANRAQQFETERDAQAYCESLVVLPTSSGPGIPANWMRVRQHVWSDVSQEIRDESDEALDLRDDWEKLVQEKAELLEILRGVGSATACFCGREGENVDHSSACERARAVLLRNTPPGLLRRNANERVG